MPTESFFEDSTVGAPTPRSKAPHDFRLQGAGGILPLGFYCIHCGLRQNEAGELCQPRKAVE